MAKLFWENGRESATLETVIRTYSDPLVRFACSFVGSASVAEELMEDALESGAEDFVAEDEVFEIYTVPEDLSAIRAELESKGYKIVSAEKDKIPSNYVTLESEDAIKDMNLLLEKLDENDDVQNVYHNWENNED